MISEWNVTVDENWCRSLFSRYYDSFCRLPRRLYAVLIVLEGRPTPFPSSLWATYAYIIFFLVSAYLSTKIFAWNLRYSLIVNLFEIRLEFYLQICQEWFFVDEVQKEKFLSNVMTKIFGCFSNYSSPSESPKSETDSPTYLISPLHSFVGYLNRGTEKICPWVLEYLCCNDCVVKMKKWTKLLASTFKYLHS